MSENCETGRDLAVYRRRIPFADARRGIAPLLLAVPVFLAEEDLSKQSLGMTRAQDRKEGIFVPENIKDSARKG